MSVLECSTILSSIIVMSKRLSDRRQTSMLYTLLSRIVPVCTTFVAPTPFHLFIGSSTGIRAFRYLDRQPCQDAVAWNNFAYSLHITEPPEPVAAEPKQGEQRSLESVVSVQAAVVAGFPRRSVVHADVRGLRREAQQILRLYVQNCRQFPGCVPGHPLSALFRRCDGLHRHA